LREAVGRNAPVLIDQEGGRVQRMGPPHWPKYPPGRAYGRMHVNDPLTQREMARLGARLIAHDLLSVGINVDCLPVLDLPAAGAHDIVGDRAYGTDVAVVATLGRAAAEGLLAGGVLPVVKHMPGHGRAMVDSHVSLPVVEAPLESLEAADFLPFRMLADMPLAMSAHVVYTAIDPRAPATTSRRVIRGIIRGTIGFDGLLMSDDLSMQALSGGLGERAKAAFAAGCDIGLHCNGRMDEMIAVSQEAPILRGAALRRARSALARLNHLPEPIDVAEARARLGAALATLAAA
jgi:beta-N-acetylhexosaminidase